VQDLLARAERILGRQQSADPISRTELMVSVGQQYISLDENGKALRILATAYDSAQGLPDLSLRAAADCSYAGALANNSETARAEGLIQAGLALLPSGPQYALDGMHCYMRGSAVARAAGNSVQGIDRALTAREMLKQSLYTSPLLENSVTGELAEAYREA